MRRPLFAAVAAAPLALCMASAAPAQTTVSSNSSTPLATSSAGDVTIASGATLTLNSTTPGITVDSNNNVAVTGAISADNVSNATGVLLTGGHTGSLATTGPITLSEDYAATDTVNGDSVVEAPFAQGTGRYGVRLTGTAPFTGAISLGGAIAIKGQNSYGVSLEAPLAGSLSTTAAVTLTGDNGAGVRETAGVTGGVTIGSTITTTGQGSQALVLTGDVGGAVRLQSALTSTGYSDTTRLTSTTQQAALQTTALDVEQSGSTVTVGANVAGGLYISGVPVNTVSGTLADVDGDGVADGAETNGSITIFGTAPALVIGAPGASIAVGNFGTGADAYGLLNRGAIAASGLEDGVASTALQIGAVGGTVSLGGGLRNTGSIGATSYEADATAVHILGGASVAALQNEGALAATILDSPLTTTTASGTATGVLIEAGANVGSLTNTGTISASGAGDALNGQAVVDRSGTLASVLNEGRIAAIVTTTTVGDALTGRSVALDLSQNTTGVTLIQQANPTTSLTYGSTSGTTDTATTTVTPAAPSIVGDILLGSGVNTVQLLSGTVIGALSLGKAAGSSFLIDGGASYAGALSYTGPSLALNLNNGSLTDLATGTLNLSSLAIGTTGVLTVTVDPAAGTNTRFAVSGAATVASGGAIGVRLASAPLTSAPQAFVLISSPALSVSNTASLTATTSYIFDSSFAADPTAGALTLTLARKSAAELGLAASESGSLDGVLSGIRGDANLTQAVLAPTTKAAFIQTYDQLLPEHGGAVFLAAREAAESVGRAVSDRYDLPNAVGGWLQEFGVGVQQDRDAAVKEQAGGFGFAGGAETADAGFGAIGVTAAFVDADIKDPDLHNASRTTFDELEAGLYWRAKLGGLQLTARGGGGYLFGHDQRYVQIGATDATDAISQQARATWHGYTEDARGAASYQFTLGRLFVRPQVSGEYFRLKQNAYDETGAESEVDLSVDSRTGHSASGTGSVVLGARLGDGIVWQPTLELGARDVFSGDAGVTTARVSAGGNPFALVANPITGVGGLFTLGLKVGGPIYQIFVDAHGEDYAHYREGDFRAGVKVVF